MLAWLSLNMGLSHELIQNERGCLIYEVSPRFVFEVLRVKNPCAKIFLNPNRSLEKASCHFLMTDLG